MPGNCDRVVERALDFWDQDQRTAALNLAARLPKDPARFAHMLAGTKHGAALMIERWDTLAQIARSCGDWDAGQRRMALDLLGIPSALQAGCTAIAPAGDKEALIALATGQAERLRARIAELLDEQSAQDQADTIAGLLVAADADTKLLRTYERQARRDYDRAHAELLRVQAEAAAAAREQAERERKRQFDELSTPPSVPPEERQASAAAAPTGAEPTSAARPSSSLEEVRRMIALGRRVAERERARDRRQSADRQTGPASE